MKKLLLIAVIAILGIGNVNAQEAKFGLVGGFHNLSIKASESGTSLSVDGQGFYVGISGEFNLSETLNLQTELQFANASKDGESTDLVVLPVMVKYYVSEKINLQAGPQFDFVVSESEGINVFGLGLGIGAGYDINENFYLNTRYTFGLSNRLEDAPSNVSVKFNVFQAGLGYRF